MRCAWLLLFIPLAGCLSDGPSLDIAPEDIPLVASAIVQVDADRWSGEPSILAMRDGTLLITGAGGMTRYVEDPSDFAGNGGQSYIWRSTDDGATWQFVDLGLPEQIAPYRNAILGVEGDLAEDAAGNAYFVDLTFLAANGLAVSDDSGETWLAQQQPLVGLPGTDRPWVAAVGEGNVYVKYLQMGTGHRVALSTDRGASFLADDIMPSCGQADLTVDQTAAEVLVPCTAGGALSVLRASAGSLDWERIPVALADGTPVDGDSAFVFPSLAVARSGQYVFAWSQATPEGAEIRVTHSTDRGATWSPHRVLSTPNATAVFAWTDANAAGDVAVTWYEADQFGDSNTIDAEWRVHHATLALAEDGTLGPATVTVVTEEPVHRGSICTAGLGCVLGGRSDDRRLLDFFEIDVDAAGISHIAYTNTQGPVPTIWYAQVAAMESV